NDRPLSTAPLSITFINRTVHAALQVVHACETRLSKTKPPFSPRRRSRDSRCLLTAKTRTMTARRLRLCSGWSISRGSLAGGALSRWFLTARVGLAVCAVEQSVERLIASSRLLEIVDHLLRRIVLVMP